jgi:DtxR family Mn-dependent transcriptional regulator
MTDPRIALLAFGALVALALAVAWPRRGLAARLRRLARRTPRVQAEDALKYLLHAGEGGVAVRPEALAGALDLRSRPARALLAALCARGFVDVSGQGFVLTEAGRRDALRLVRSHRLLERWLAEHTGVAPDEWHEFAEEGEHDLTPEEADALAAHLGDPRYDPHGDPIPTATGELPVDARRPLGDIATGEAGVVAHLEDEPADAYAALRAAGLALGGTIVVRDRDAATLSLDVDGTAVRLPRWLEASVSVTPSVRRATMRPRTLADLRPGEVGHVARIVPACRGAQRRRLLDLGVVPGTEITAELRSAGGDPTAYRVRGALVALRRQQAAWIELEPGVPTAAAAIGPSDAARPVAR